MWQPGVSISGVRKYDRRLNVQVVMKSPNFASGIQVLYGVISLKRFGILVLGLLAKDQPSEIQRNSSLGWPQP